MDTKTGALEILNPQAAEIAARNDQRISRRQAAAALSEQAGRTGAQGLRRGPQRRIGGRFERLQAVPSDTIKIRNASLGGGDIEDFLRAFVFESQENVLTRSSTSQILPTSNLAPGFRVEPRSSTRRITGF